MTDIVKRLREGVFGGDETKTDVVIHSHMQAGADEIERLRAERDEAQAEANAGRQAEQDADVERRAVESERDRLREALREIVQQCFEHEDRGNIAVTALAALKEIS
jgi:uncharacterized protein (DUF3084 family)